MKTESVKKNFFYQMIYEILIIILPFITSPYIARVIGAEGLGIYSYSYSIAYYFVLFSMLGLKNYGNRVIAQNRDNKETLNKTFSNIFAIHAVIVMICLVVYMIYVYNKRQEQIYALIQTAYVMSSLFDISWFYFGIEKFKLTVTRSTIIKILNVICVFVFVKTSDDLWKYCLIMSVGILVSQLTLWIPLKKYVSLKKPQWREMKTHIKPLLILFIPAIAVSLYKYMDKIMIGALSSKAQLGFYENAEKVTNIPMSIIAAFGTVMLPKVSFLLANKSHKKVMEYINISMEYVMCLSFALAFGLAAVGTTFAPVFWGEEFAYSGILIMGLSITIPFISFANVIRTEYLIPTEKDRDYLISVISGALINLIINWFFIPKFGAKGAMIGTIAAEIIVCIIQTQAVHKDLPISLYIKNSLPFFIMGLIMFGIVFSMGSYFGGGLVILLVQILSGMILYCAFCLAYFIKRKDKIILGIINTLVRR